MKTTRQPERDGQRPQVPEEIREAIEQILDCLWDDEAVDYFETTPAEDRECHIFVPLQCVRRWLR